MGKAAHMFLSSAYTLHSASVMIAVIHEIKALVVLSPASVSLQLLHLHRVHSSFTTLLAQLSRLSLVNRAS